MKRLLQIAIGWVCVCSANAQAGLYSPYPGLNMTLSVAVTVSPGAGSGFSNSLSIAYADSIMSRLSYAVGGYAHHYSWNGRSFSDTGLTAMLNYRFDEHWEATLYVQKGFVEPRTPMMPYWMLDEMADKIGAEVCYHFSPAFSVGVSVWRISYSDVKSPFKNTHQPPAFYGGR